METKFIVSQCRWRAMTHTVPITLHLDAELLGTLVRAASDMGLSVAEYATRLLEIAAHDFLKIDAITEAFSDETEWSIPLDGPDRTEDNSV